MTISTLTNIAAILLLVGWIAVRQLRWQPAKIAGMWRLPLIVGIVGIFETVSSAGHPALTSVDVVVLALELVVSLVVGGAMGLIAQFRPATAKKRSDDTDPAIFESRTGWFGLVLWVVMIGIRIGVDVWAGSLGSTIAASTGIILVMVAANRAARAIVFAGRVARLAPLADTVVAGARAVTGGR